MNALYLIGYLLPRYCLRLELIDNRNKTVDDVFRHRADKLPINR